MSSVLTIGILREERLPRDTRVCLTPQQARSVQDTYPVLQVLVQPSPYRCFSDEEYRDLGLELSEDMSRCEVLMGVKQVPVDRLLSGKTYLMFSHTLKQQAENRALLQAVLAKQITLVDYECMTRSDGSRLLGFGRFAGMVGTHTGLWAYGKRTGLYDLPRAVTCGSLDALITRLKQQAFPPLHILVAGSGRVAKGACELLDAIGFQRMELTCWSKGLPDVPGYTICQGATLYERIHGAGYDRTEFHTHPERYHSRLDPYIPWADVLINGVYWTPGSPPLLDAATWNPSDWRLRTIADISCDPGGAIPLNLGPSSMAEPVYGVDPVTKTRLSAFDPRGLDVVAVDNLPSELPRDASEHFGEMLQTWIIPALIRGSDPLIQRACMTEHGRLCDAFHYLNAYVNEA